MLVALPSGCLNACAGTSNRHPLLPHITLPGNILSLRARPARARDSRVTPRSPCVTCPCRCTCPSAPCACCETSKRPQPVQLAAGQQAARRRQYSMRRLMQWQGPSPAAAVVPWAAGNAVAAVRGTAAGSHPGVPRHLVRAQKHRRAKLCSLNTCLHVVAGARIVAAYCTQSVDHVR